MVHKFIVRPEKMVCYVVGGFEFNTRGSADFLHSELKRHARIESDIYIKAVEDHEEICRTRLEYPEFTAFFTERLLGHWQKMMRMENNSHREVVARVRELMDGGDW